MVKLLNSKKAWETGKSFPALFIGLIIAAFGLINLGVVAFQLPFTPGENILAILLSLGGLFLLYSGFREVIDPSFGPLIGWIAVLTGIIMAGIGTATIGILPIALPAFLLSIPANILFIIIGALLIFLSFAY